VGNVFGQPASTGRAHMAVDSIEKLDQITVYLDTARAIAFAEVHIRVDEQAVESTAVTDVDMRDQFIIMSWFDLQAIPQANSHRWLTNAAVQAIEQKTIEYSSHDLLSLVLFLVLFCLGRYFMRPWLYAG
jgi:hypothetical protein